jgi:oligoendopeptidase F
MTQKRVPRRDEVDPKYTWDAQSVFETTEAWEAGVVETGELIEAMSAWQGRLAEGPTVLLEALTAVYALLERVSKLQVYAALAASVDRTDQAAVERAGRGQGVYSKAVASVSFVAPELLAVGQETLAAWAEEETGLAIYGHYFDDLFRRQAHVRSAEIEELLGLIGEPFSGTYDTFSMMTEADFTFAPAVTVDGQELPVAQGILEEILAGTDRQARQTAYNSYTDAYLAYKNTLTSNLATSMKQNVLEMRARRHESTLGMTLFGDNIPVEVFDSLIATFRRNLPTWHRYWAVRRQILGLESLQPYDIWAPLTADPARIPYQQAVDYICDSLAPLGGDYVDALRRGCLEDRWIDLYPNQGKAAGAFSWGTQGTHPFIVMSYTDDVYSVGTLAHELGHSMHSYLTWQNQPPVYSDYTTFAAEVASNFHQAMLRAYLLENSSDHSLQIGLIEEAMANFHRYFLVMPTLARFELAAHQRLEEGQGLTADALIDSFVELMSEGFGQEMEFDRDRLGILWATFQHLYADYYVFQYATGISGANALANGILAGREGAVENYLSFLKSGGSMYPIDALRMAGVDLARPDAVEETFEVLAGLVDRLEQLAVSD